MPLRGGATASEVARVLSASQAAVLFGVRLALAAQAVARDCVGLTLAMVLAMAKAMMKSPVAIGVMVLPPDAGVSQDSIVLNNQSAAESMAVMYRSLSSQSDLPPAARRFIVAPEWHGRVHISRWRWRWRGRGLPKESATSRASFV